MTMTSQRATPWIALAGFVFIAACGPVDPPAVATTSTAGTPSAEAPASAALPPGHPPLDAAGQADMARGKVVETMNSGGYTYVRAQPAGGKEFWAATTEFPVKIGDEIVVDTAMPMQNYESSTLKRTFDNIYFAEAIQVLGQGAPQPIGAQPSLLRQVSAPPIAMPGAAAAMPSGHGSPSSVKPESVELKGIEKAAGGLTVAEVLAQADALSGKPVAFRGKVVKFTARVMGKNWLHVRDGSGADGAADMTVTTDAEAAIGDLVLVKGTVATKQDFGSGYSYPVLVQDATIEKQ